MSPEREHDVSLIAQHFCGVRQDDRRSARLVVVDKTQQNCVTNADAQKFGRLAVSIVLASITQPIRIPSAHIVQGLTLSAHAAV